MTVALYVLCMIAALPALYFFVKLLVWFIERSERKFFRVMWEQRENQLKIEEASK